MKLYLSIDLESWAYPDDPRFIGLSSAARKALDAGFVLESIDSILDLLARYSQKITFFAIAELFEWYPEAFRRIKKAGHEIAYHTHKHIKITSGDVIKREILVSRDFLNEFKPAGFRAPEIYLSRDGVRPLAEAGFRYSSSVYGSYMDVFDSGENGFKEFPVSTSLRGPAVERALNYPRPMNFSMLLKELPFGGGYFLAALPLSVIEKNIERYLKAGKPVFMFCHNWQIVRPKNSSFPDAGYKLTHPFYLPYTFNIGRKIGKLLERYGSARMDELI